MISKQIVARSGLAAVGVCLTAAMLSACQPTTASGSVAVGAGTGAGVSVSVSAPSNPVSSNPASSNPAPSGPASSNAAPSNPAPSSPALSGVGTSTPECTASDLRISATGGGAGLGHQSEILIFTNTGSATCFIQGYPGVAEIDQQSHILQNASRTPNGYLGGLGSNQSTPPRVTLHPGVAATALIEALDATTSGTTACIGQSATAVLVTAPDQRSNTSVPVMLQACADFQVHPVTASADGDQQ
jgi:hypothetical protein